MRTLFTGATGVIGRMAVPLLIEAGHHVRAVTRSTEGRAWLESIGAEPVEVDLFDTESVRAAAAGTDRILNFATAIPPLSAMSKRASWTANDELRTEATANLVDAAVAMEVAGFIQESITFFYADGRGDWIDEESPIDPAWDVLDSALTAEHRLERFTEAGGRGVSLRLSSLYGPRASAEYLASIAARKSPVVGSGANFVSHLHVEDAGTAVVASLTAPSGVCNVTDDLPVTAREDAERVAELLGVKPPRRIPVSVAKAFAGPAVGLLTTSHRISNRKFRQVTGWSPRHPSVETGWEEVISKATPTT